MNKRFLFVLAALAVSGCAPSTKYNWGTYPTSLYEYYRDPTREAAYVASLEKIIKAEAPNRKIPPGILAEYGYVEMSRGNTSAAIALFEREKKNWPESTNFMDAAIKLAQSGTKNRDASSSTTKPVS